MLSRFTQAKRQHSARQQQRSSKFQTTKATFTSENNHNCVDNYQLGNDSLRDSAMNNAAHETSAQSYNRSSNPFHFTMISNMSYNSADLQRYHHDDTTAALCLLSMNRDRNVDPPCLLKSLQGGYERRTLPSPNSSHKASTSTNSSCNKSAPTSEEFSNTALLTQEKGSTKSGSSTAPCKSPTTQVSAFYGSVSLYTSGDDDTLSPVHCFIRKFGIEAFVLTEEQAADADFWNGRNFKVRPGFVGMRCLHCRNVPFADRYQKSVHYPSSTTCLYYSMENWQRSHLEGCPYIPFWVPKELSRLVMESKNSAGGRRNYWSSSAKALGMEDVYTPRLGVIFKSDPRQNTSTKLFELPDLLLAPPDLPLAPPDCTTKKSKIILVQPEDELNVSYYLFLLLSQMEYCTFSEEDRTGSRSKIKNIKIGFPGIQCKHCRGTAGTGRYFPATPQALSLANSDRNIQNHLNKCRRCPEKVRRDLVKAREMQNAKVLRGTRKAFFYKIWERLHGNSNASSCGSTISSLSIDSEEGSEIYPNAGVPMEMSIFRPIANDYSSMNARLFQPAHLSLDGGNRATAPHPRSFLYETDSQINMNANIPPGTYGMHDPPLHSLTTTEMATASYNITAATHRPYDFKQDPSKTSCDFVDKSTTNTSTDASISTASSMLYAFSQNFSIRTNIPTASRTLNASNQNSFTESHVSPVNRTYYESNENVSNEHQPTSNITRGL